MSLKQRECSTPASQNGIFMLSSAELISYISSAWIVFCLITTIGQTWLEKEKSLYSKTSLLEADVEMRSLFLQSWRFQLQPIDSNFGGRFLSKGFLLSKMWNSHQGISKQCWSSLVDGKLTLELCMCCATSCSSIWLFFVVESKIGNVFYKNH